MPRVQASGRPSKASRRASPSAPRRTDSPLSSQRPRPWSGLSSTRPASTATRVAAISWRTLKRAAPACSRASAVATRNGRGSARLSTKISPRSRRTSRWLASKARSTALSVFRVSRLPSGRVRRRCSPTPVRWSASQSRNGSACRVASTSEAPPRTRARCLIARRRSSPRSRPRVGRASAGGSRPRHCSRRSARSQAWACCGLRCRHWAQAWRVSSVQPLSCRRTSHSAASSRIGEGIRPSSAAFIPSAPGTGGRPAACSA
ncbi:hypothetical protein PAERUG_E7_London_9_VIM_2_02_13_01437 [Pseudomonas aeruginosa]|nr:hypothetical protein PAERUG_E7_London_9_VIM_2_02_13_01437 [Pseudomonas aeruginosa]CRR60573.1 hypothetical protein PAERUG_P5_London_26_VIM_2_01_09_01376 [Pseudomonas aeruginosa]